jgi:hypothetical protein
MSAPASNQPPGVSWLGSVFMVLGLLAIYIGERIVDAGNQRIGVTAVGAVILVGSLAYRALRMRSSDGERRSVEKALLGLGLVALAALAIYFATSDVFTKLDGRSLEQDSPKLAGALTALWPALLTAALLPRSCPTPRCPALRGSKRAASATRCSAAWGWRAC